jgi:2-keto-4-pentenoate hydratase
MRQMKCFFYSRIFIVVLVAVFVAGAGPNVYGRRIDSKKMIEQMLAGRKSQTQIPSLTKTYGPFNIKRAYQIQQNLARELGKELGPLAGYKVAYASEAARKQFGIREPASGPLFGLQRVPNGSTLPAKTFVEITLETEIAFTIGKRIDREIEDVAQIRNYVQWVHAAFDAGNFPFTSDTSPTVQDMIAIGTGAHVFVLGPAVEPDKIDIDTLRLKLIRNGETLADSPATDVMGSPWNSLLWCANHIVKLGGTLEPGSVIVTGTAAPAYKVKGDPVKGHYVGDCGPLGTVTMTVR